MIQQNKEDCVQKPMVMMFQTRQQNSKRIVTHNQYQPNTDVPTKSVEMVKNIDPYRYFSVPTTNLILLSSPNQTHNTTTVVH